MKTSCKCAANITKGICLVAVLAGQITCCMGGEAERTTAVQESKPLRSGASVSLSQPRDGAPTQGVRPSGVHYDLTTGRTVIDYGVPTTARQSAQGLQPPRRTEGDDGSAMRRYQERWESHVRDPFASPRPTLYPSRVQQVLEGGR